MHHPKLSGGAGSSFVIPNTKQKPRMMAVSKRFLASNWLEYRQKMYVLGSKSFKEECRKHGKSRPGHRRRLLYRGKKRLTYSWCCRGVTCFAIINRSGSLSMRFSQSPQQFLLSRIRGAGTSMKPTAKQYFRIDPPNCVSE